MSQIRKILCVGSHRQPSNAYRRTLTFEDMGHQVFRVDTSKFGHFQRQILRRIALGPGKLIVHHMLKRFVIRAIEGFQPEMIWLEKSLLFNLKDLAEIRAVGPRGMQLVHYNPDEPFGYFGGRMWKVFIQSISGYDVHLVPKECNICEYRNHGASRVYAFDRSYDPKLHRAIELSESDTVKFGCEVGFVGTWATQREASIAALIQAGIPVAVWGDGWHRGEHWSVIRKHWRGPSQSGDNYTKAICGMKIALHFLRHENRDEQDSRTFEIPACGTFMLAERSAAHERLFKDDVEAVLFDSIKELEEKLRYYLAHDEERQEIERRGLQRCQESGYDHNSRLTQFVELVFEC